MTAAVQPGGGSTILATILRDKGSTNRTMGKANAKERPQACIQILKKSGPRPTPRTVEIPETKNVMIVVKMNGRRIPAARLGSLRNRNDGGLDVMRTLSLEK